MHEVDDGLVVYDAERDRVHYLNATAAVVFTFCDGHRRVADIADLVASAWELDAAPIEAVQECVAKLRDEGVLT